MAKRFSGTVETDIKVRLCECDPYEIAHNSSYFVWFEMGRFQYAEENGYALPDMAANDDVVYITLHTRCKYIKSCKFNDEITVRTWIRKPPLLFAKYNFEQKIFNKKTGELIARCWTENAAVSKSEKRVLRIYEDESILKVEDKWKKEKDS
ncbi:MAG TPA: acyl-CoA thioesterase [Candidatus Copromorpha excrementigallinarum]|uniref:Acyl-CoA thioesterase n=1 Tax=Candidatus Allocopromorpha excrementigallinarum TaxID=2840742 RepID=A0A9D1L6X1_9FIRM|nr:acyl-CoA thioesterase [Candidatus Copromorpha excrementigallinarum]